LEGSARLLAEAAQRLITPDIAAREAPKIARIEQAQTVGELLDLVELADSLAEQAWLQRMRQPALGVAGPSPSA